MGNPVVHFEILTANPVAVQDFYADMFGWEINADNPIGYGLVRTGAGRGIDGGIAPASEQHQGNLVTFYVEVDDPQAAMEKAVELGARAVVPVTEVPGMVTFGLFADPEGNIVGLVKSEAEPAG